MPQTGQLLTDPGDWTSRTIWNRPPAQAIQREILRTATPSTTSLSGLSLRSKPNSQRYCACAVSYWGLCSIVTCLPSPPNKEIGTPAFDSVSIIREQLLQLGSDPLPAEVTTTRADRRTHGQRHKMNKVILLKISSMKLIKLEIGCQYFTILDLARVPCPFKARPHFTH